MKKVGILGGTFSPPHIGHLAMAKAALNHMNLDKVIFIPCGYPPHKDVENIFNSKLRLELTKTLVENEPKFEVSDWEIENEGKSYTAKTLTHFVDTNEDCEYYFIVGADSLCYMDEWMNPEVIFEKAKIIVIDREGYTDNKINEYISFLKGKYNADIFRIKMPQIKISSTKLRNMLKEKKDISRYTNKKIQGIILEHLNEQNNKLYTK